MDDELVTIFEHFIECTIKARDVNPFLAPNEQEAERLRSLQRPLTARETARLLWHDGNSIKFGVAPPVCVRWDAIRKLVKARPIVLYIQQRAVERAGSAGGRARAEDVAAWAALSETRDENEEDTPP